MSLVLTATYRKAAEILGVELSWILHVANHSFDCIGAQAAGMKRCLVNRRRCPWEETPYQPHLVVDDFRTLADALA